MDSLTNANWRPYWSDGRVANADSKTVKISAWTKRGQNAFHVFCATGRKETWFQKIKVADALTGAVLPVNNGTIKLNFSAMNYRTLEIR